jgi:hypothetical protein
MSYFNCGAFNKDRYSKNELMRESCLIIASIACLSWSSLNASEPAFKPATTAASDSTRSDTEQQILRTTRLALFIPGAGQLSNQNYFKAACVWGGFAYGVKFLIDNTRDLKNTRTNLIAAIEQDFDFFAINTLTERETYDQRYRDLSWMLLAGIHGLSILDAHVSANLQSFDVSEDLSLRWGFFRLQNQSTLGLTLNWQPGLHKRHHL